MSVEEVLNTGLMWVITIGILGVAAGLAWNLVREAWRKQ